MSNDDSVLTTAILEGILLDGMQEEPEQEQPIVLTDFQKLARNAGIEQSIYTNFSKRQCLPNSLLQVQDILYDAGYRPGNILLQHAEYLWKVVKQIRKEA